MINIADLLAVRARIENDEFAEGDKSSITTDISGQASQENRSTESVPNNGPVSVVPRPAMCLDNGRYYVIERKK